jgi:hypothetical protein
MWAEVIRQGLFNDSGSKWKPYVAGRFYGNVNFNPDTTAPNTYFIRGAWIFLF